MDLWGREENLDYLENQESRACLENLEEMEKLEIEEKMDIRARLVHQEPLASLVKKVWLGYQV